VAQLRKQRFVRQPVTNKVFVPPKGNRKNHLTIYLLSVDLSAVCTLYLRNVSLACKEEKVVLVLESSQKETEQNNVCLSKNYVLLTCVSLVRVFQDGDQWL
jgi:hypothetical protein